MQIDNGSHFTICSKSELILLEDLVREFNGKISIKKKEVSGLYHWEIETASESIRDFVYHQINSLRENQKKIEKVYTRKMTPDEQIMYQMFEDGVYKNFA